LVPVAIVVTLHYFFRRWVTAETLLPHHDVAGFLVAVVGVIYAVVLGFVVITVWVAFDNAQRNADVEAGDAAELAQLAQLYPAPTRDRLRLLVGQYAFEVRDREWPMLVYGEQDLTARSLMIRTLREVVFARSSRPALQENAQRILGDLSMHRRQRLIDAEDHLESILYVVLLVGALIVFAFVFLFGVRNAIVQLTITGLVSTSIMLLLALIVEFDAPYSGGIRVSPAAWTLIIENNHLESAAPSRHE
jgi:hypothetical protein